MTYTLPAWQDTPSIATPLSSTNLLSYNAAVNDLDSRVTSNTSNIATNTSNIATNTSGKVDKSTLTTKGDLYVATGASTPARFPVGSDTQVLTADTAQSTGVKWSAIAESQVTNLTTDLANGPDDGYGAPGVWSKRVYGDLMSNMDRSAATSAYAMLSTTRTQLVLLGFTPAASYSTFRLWITTAANGSPVATAALYSSATLSNTSWSRLGAGNVTPTITATGLVSTSLSFTLGADAWVLLELVITTTPTSIYPSFAATPTGGVAAMLNPSGTTAPVSANANASSAPGSTLNPTTGFTALAQKVWCALA